MLSIYHSNRLDILKDLLVELLRREPPENPLQNEQILVQSPGMAQWLRLQLAESLGIAAGMEFPLPASFLWKMYTKVLPDVPKRSAFNKEAMTWKIMALLPDMIDQPAFIPLKQYLSEDDDGIRCFQLAGKIADIFDQYLVYRPDWINDWEQNLDSAGITDDQLWQPELWRTLVAKTEELHQSPWHRANMHHRFIQTLTEGSHQQDLPKRLFVFGISALPPHFVESLAAMGRQIEIHLLIMNPCQHYWGDERDPKYLRKLAAKRFAERKLTQTIVKITNTPREHWLHKEGLSLDNLDAVGNPLLGSMGKLGRDYFHQLHTLDAFDVDVFVNDHSNSLLHLIQQDILNLNDRIRDSASPVTGQYQSEDSLQFHSCYSPLREVEVLHDRLLDMFEKNPELKPRDVAVMLPDIDTYSPWIQAVFGSINYHDARYIPFSISDRSASNEHPILPALLYLLELDRSRCTAPELLELLEIPALQNRFGFTDTDLNIIRQWVDRSGIRWGLDAYHQSQFGVPELRGNTWLFGLRRMLLGYAMPEELGVHQGILPFDQVQGMDAVLAGQLASFIEQAEHLVGSLDQERTIEQWILFINDLQERFFKPDDEDEYALMIVRDALERLHEQLNDADHDETLSRAIMLSYLTERLTAERSSQRFLAGQVNFCTLMPMRSIPFNVVCLLGMNDGAYPRSIPPAGFDLIAQHSRRGDRSRRQDDRYLFLEAVLSAQQTLYISFVGKRIQDASERIPSVLVSELLDYCEQGFGLTPEQMITKHPLQAFSPSQYLQESGLFSYAHEWVAAAARSGIAPEAFIKGSLKAQDTPKEIELAELLRFYNNPCKYFSNRRLKVFFDEQDHVLSETEPFAIEGLESYLLLDELLQSCIQEESEGALRTRLIARGSLPHAAFGELWLDEQLDKVTPMSLLIVPLVQQKQDDLEVNEDIEVPVNEDSEKYRLTGWLKNNYDSGLIRYRPAKVKGKDVMSTWIEHLCSCLKEDSGQTHLIGLTDAFYFSPVEQNTARQYLAILIEQYLIGQKLPLPWFPQTAYSWLQKEPDNEPEKAQQAADISFYGGFRNRPRAESSDAYIARIHPKLDLVQTEFETLANTLMLPALRHMQKVKA